MKKSELAYGFGVYKPWHFWIRLGFKFLAFKMEERFWYRLIVGDACITRGLSTVLQNVLAISQSWSLEVIENLLYENQRKNNFNKYHKNVSTNQSQQLKWFQTLRPNNWSYRDVNVLMPCNISVCNAESYEAQCSINNSSECVGILTPFLRCTCEYKEASDKNSGVWSKKKSKKECESVRNGLPVRLRQFLRAALLHTSHGTIWNFSI